MRKFVVFFFWRILKFFSRSVFRPKISPAVFCHLPPCIDLEQRNIWVWNIYGSFPRRKRNTCNYVKNLNIAHNFKKKNKNCLANGPNSQLKTSIYGAYHAKIQKKTWIFDKTLTCSKQKNQKSTYSTFFFSKFSFQLLFAGVFHVGNLRE